MIDVSGDFGNIRFYKLKHQHRVNYLRYAFSLHRYLLGSDSGMPHEISLDSTMMTSDSPRRNLLAASSIT